MRIAQIAPLTESVPPKLYGGTERVVSYITEALVDLGHDVTLFASGDSITRAKLDAVWPRALRLDSSIRDRIAPHMLLMETVARRARDFDVLHFHMDYYSFSVFKRQETPFVTTLHGRLDLPEQQPVFDTFDTAPVISISNAQRQPMPQAKWLTTVYHGLPETLYTPQPVEQSYLAFLGRISPEKRVDTAIRIAQRCGMRLRIAAKIDAADEEYFEREIKPLFALPHVEYIGEIADHEKAAFLSGAHALLFPIDWPEPFGLVMIEAMACGTPVIAFNRGAVPEVIDEGMSGFIVEDEISAVAAVNRLHTLSRERVRARFEERFTSRRMAQQYVDVYQSLIRAQKRARFKVIDSAS
ncbi:MULTISPECIES: glycosyltransferase family 4 protein [Burkholderia]|uniref:Glycosyl transferase n=1 Tax=Burkholderia mayonis TaxID=1385591 RepID=A0A1B4FDF1_9BURK|nr:MULTISPECIES: glycosyltransferase family 4 protein [Burkholderia]AOJ01703.1 glycosyl transferase [Burkholderia mayonis]KVE40644.1 glycosyl transferase [Burkholderia sp. BDU5]KVE47437.1 glycosyl transferase [Burkholderia mayonis]